MSKGIPTWRSKKNAVVDGLAGANGARAQNFGLHKNIFEARCGLCHVCAVKVKKNTALRRNYIVSVNYQLLAINMA